MAEEKKAEKKGMIGEFMEFLMKYQVIGLAVAFIIGAAATKMVTAAVNDIIMPVTVSYTHLTLPTNREV